MGARLPHTPASMILCDFFFPSLVLKPTYFQKECKREGNGSPKNIHTSETASMHQYPPCASSEQGVFPPSSTIISNISGVGERITSYTPTGCERKLPMQAEECVHGRELTLLGAVAFAKFSSRLLYVRYAQCPVIAALTLLS